MVEGALLRRARAAFDGAASRWDDAQRAAEAEIDRYVWSRGEALALEPLPERTGYRRARPMPTVPVTCLGKTQYGVDARGRPWIARSFGRIEPTVTVFAWSDDVEGDLAVALTRRSDAVINATVYRRVAGRVREWARVASAGSGHEEVTHDADGRVASTRMISMEGDQTRLIEYRVLDGAAMTVEGRVDGGAWGRVYPRAPTQRVPWHAEGTLAVRGALSRADVLRLRELLALEEPLPAFARRLQGGVLRHGVSLGSAVWYASQLTPAGRGALSLTLATGEVLELAGFTE